MFKNSGRPKNVRDSLGQKEPKVMKSSKNKPAPNSKRQESLLRTLNGGKDVETLVTSNSERPKNLPPQAAQHFSGQSSTCQPKFFIKTFGWPMVPLPQDCLVLSGVCIRRRT